MSSAQRVVLVLQGAGMDQRGRVQIDIFGPETLADIDAGIRGHAHSLALSVDIWQHNDEAELVADLEALQPGRYVAGLINPSGFTDTTGPLPGTIARLDFPVWEVHASNPAARGRISSLLPVCAGGISGFGYAGYRMALDAIHRQLDAAH